MDPLYLAGDVAWWARELGDELLREAARRLLEVGEALGRLEQEGGNTAGPSRSP